jgi:hypothetical protein
MKTPELKKWLDDSRLFIYNIMFKYPRFKKELEEFSPIVDRFGNYPSVINALVTLGKLLWKPGEP